MVFACGRVLGPGLGLEPQVLDPGLGNESLVLGLGLEVRVLVNITALYCLHSHYGRRCNCKARLRMKVVIGKRVIAVDSR